MNEFLQSLLDSTNVPFLSALLLGLLTAISPCPLATNIAAVGFIARNAGEGHRAFLSGVAYTVGRVLAYTALGVVLISIIRTGADSFGLQQTISEWGERLLAPALIVIGVLMLLGDRLHLPSFGFKSKGEKMKGFGSSLLLGMLFAMAFCPTSALFYFGMLIPMSVGASAGYLLPVCFALATALPVLIVAWLLTYSVGSVGKFYNSLQVVQRWLNRIVAVLFIVIGIYYLYVTYL